MKSITILLTLIILALSNLNFAQTTDYNLKKLNQVYVKIVSNGFLSDKIEQKLETEIKLKLMSAGIKVVPRSESKAVLHISCDAIKSAFAEHRIVTIMTITEKVITEREARPETDALTYFDYSFFTSKEMENSIYNKIMDVMIINFIENYLSANQ